MSSAKAMARKSGILYLMILILAPFNHIYISSHFFVPGNPAATARNISADTLIYRLGVLSGLVSEIILLFLVTSLYRLLKDVDRKQARLMVGLVTVSVAIGLVNLLNQAAPLLLLSGARVWSVFTEHQLDLLSYVFLRLRSSGIYLAMAFWGLWLLPLGILVIKSRLFPRLLGILLIVGCFAYLAVSVTALAWPAHMQVVDQAMQPFYAIGELATILWLLVKGVKESPVEARPSYAA